MNNLKNEKGITLISLVITIVVLTIIATIAVSVSTLNNGLIDETITSTKDSQINKYIELIEITRQEALSREYVLEMNGETVLHEMFDIMTDDYADEIYTNAKTLSEDEDYITFITAEGYTFYINEEKTAQKLEELSE